LYILLYNKISYLCSKGIKSLHKMEITTYSNFRQNLKSFLDRVFMNHTPLFITRSNGEDVVVLSKSDYESLTETLHLLSSPKNAERLLKGIQEYENGGGEEKELL